MVKFRPKRGIYIKRPVFVVAGVGVILVGVGGVSLLVWAGVISYIIGFIITDFVYDGMMARLSPKSRGGIFATYLPVIVLASFVADGISFLVLYAFAGYVKLFSFLPPSSQAIAAVAVVTAAVVYVAWIRAGMIQKGKVL